jgi:hypothetical protein
VLRHDAFQVLTARRLKQIDTASGDVVSIEQPRWLRRNQRPENALAFLKGQRGQVPAIEIDHVEGIEVLLITPPEQVIKLRSARLVKAHDFTVQNDRVWHARRKIARQPPSAFVDVAFPADEATNAAFDIGEGAEAIVLHLEQPVGTLERRAQPRERHGLELRKGHCSFQRKAIKAEPRKTP